MTESGLYPEVAGRHMPGVASGRRQDPSFAGNREGQAGRQTIRNPTLRKTSKIANSAQNALDIQGLGSVINLSSQSYFGFLLLRASRLRSLRELRRVRSPPKRGARRG